MSSLLPAHFRFFLPLLTFLLRSLISHASPPFSFPSASPPDLIFMYNYLIVA
jgi:hypothetical protein